jgi:hypothetical protein
MRQGIETVGEHPMLHLGMAQMHWLALDMGIEPRAEILRGAVEYTRRVEAPHRRYDPCVKSISACVTRILARCDNLGRLTYVQSTAQTGMSRDLPPSGPATTIVSYPL